LPAYPSKPALFALGGLAMLRPNDTRLPAIAAAIAIMSALFTIAPATAGPLDAFAMIPPTVQSVPQNDEPDTADIPARFRRQIVAYHTTEAPGTIIIDTPNTYLYLVLGGGRAIRYG